MLSSTLSIFCCPYLYTPSESSFRPSCQRPLRLCFSHTKGFAYFGLGSEPSPLMYRPGKPWIWHDLAGEDLIAVTNCCLVFKLVSRLLKRGILRLQVCGREEKRSRPTLLIGHCRSSPVMRLEPFSSFSASLLAQLSALLFSSNRNSAARSLALL